MVIRFTPSTLSAADFAPKHPANRSGRSSEKTALRSLRNEVDCTNGRASPVLMQASLRACPAGAPPSGARLLQSYSDSVWFCATPPSCHSHMNESEARWKVSSLESDQRNLGFTC